MHIAPPAEAPKVEATPMTPTEIAPAPVAARPRRRALLLGTIAIAIAAGGGGAAWFKHGHAPAIVAPAEAATTSARLPDGSFRLSSAEARMLRVEPVAVRDFRPERVAEGRISYNEDRSTPIYPPYNGRVVRVVAQPGQAVAPGDVLFEIETTDLTGAANDLLAAGDQLARARNQLELTRRNEARQRELFTVRAAARRDVEQAEADHQNAQADLRTAEASLAAARDKLRVLGRDADAIAEIERTRRVNAVVPVVAPLAGTVVQRRIGPGQWLNAGGSDPVFTIADLSDVWLVAAVRELDAPLVRVGQQVQVSVDALPGRSFPARIEHVATALDASTRRLPVRAAIADPDHVLKPEMFASFRIAVGDSQGSVAIPTGALIYRGAEAAVWEALEDTRFILRPVRTGLRDGNLVQVTEGVAPGARVVTGGALFVDRAATAD
ncbi:efflux RND transporter periplasmic adaptor subunit [Roseomonas sp. JC162]|uniref:Efflux RND transporter periplasmic adaptor subunit n=1 Tax=Neoroseomonas marina TaxID=1232220 RepID=A0A848ELW9_9PROT|nr:efflux RND transporter periplasmic adaptor subunit [Neoroseomonas marina]NMJ44380.1 efflux RND transporter periplasmic adaptor subunit [Neoroseomonas marina]